MKDRHRCVVTGWVVKDMTCALQDDSRTDVAAAAAAAAADISFVDSGAAEGQ